MGYDVEFVRICLPKKTATPVAAGQAKRLLAEAKPFDDVNTTRDIAMKLHGCRPGPRRSIDYVGGGLSYARLSFSSKAVHIENNCSARELLKLFAHMAKSFPDLLILDLQSGQLHDAKSYEEWWSRPL